MTADELRAHFNDTFGKYESLPRQYKVDPITYANCCQAVFNKAELVAIWQNQFDVVQVMVGPNKGLMFKNVELILTK